MDVELHAEALRLLTARLRDQQEQGMLEAVPGLPEGEVRKIVAATRQQGPGARRGGPCLRPLEAASVARLSGGCLQAPLWAQVYMPDTDIFPRAMRPVAHSPVLKPSLASSVNTSGHGQGLAGHL